MFKIKIMFLNFFRLNPLQTVIMKKYSVVKREVRDVEGQELRTTVLFPAGEEGKNSDKSEKG